MRKRLLSITMALSVILTGCGAASPSASINEENKTMEDTDMDNKIKVSIDNSLPFNDGKFEGFGTSLCWYANRIGYSDKLASDSARLFFDKNEGLGLTIGRYNIGGGDNPSHTHITRTDSIMPGFWNNWSYDESTGSYEWDYDWTKDANQINVLKKSIEAAGDEMIVEAFSNSAPYFMTVSGCTSGAKFGNDDNLKSDAYDAFAKYIADVMVHFKDDLGINFQSVSAMNEPYTDYWFEGSDKQEGCHFEPGDTQSSMIIAMDKALNNAGLSDCILTTSDETNIDKQILAYNALSDEAKAVVDRIDSHAYQGNKRNQLRDLALDQKKGFWMSEVDDGGTRGENALEMGAALYLADEICLDLNEMQPSAWVLWQAIGSHISTEGYMGNKDAGMGSLNDGYWGVAFANHDTEEIILTMKYYAFGQFSRYIRPNSTLVAMEGTNTASFDEANNQLVIVAVNDKASDQEKTFDLSDFNITNNTAQVIRTSGSMANGEKWATLDPATINGSDLTVTLKGNSITTFIIDATK